MKTNINTEMGDRKMSDKTSKTDDVFNISMEDFLAKDKTKTADEKKPEEKVDEVPADEKKPEEKPAEASVETEDLAAKWKKLSRQNEARAVNALAERDKLKAELEELKAAENVFTASDVDSLVNEKLTSEKKKLASTAAKTLLENELSGLEKAEEFVATVNIETFLTEDSQVDVAKIKAFSAWVKPQKQDEKKSSAPSWGQTTTQKPANGNIWAGGLDRFTK